MKKIDPLKQYAKLHQQLLAEKTSLEQRLDEINQVLGTSPSRPSAPSAPTVSARPRRGRKGIRLTLREAMTQALARGPMTRKELAQAVSALGYVSKAKDPLASMGVFLYAKNSPFKRKNGKIFLPGGAPAASEGSNGTASPRKKRVMSPEARARISAAQKARWARQRKEG